MKNIIAISEEALDLLKNVEKNTDMPINQEIQESANQLKTTLNKAKDFQGNIDRILARIAKP